MSLSAEVERLRAWEALPSAERHRDDNVYPFYNALWDAAKAALASRPVDEWSPGEVQTFLYALDRDNEDEWIVDVVAEDEGRLLFFAEAALTGGEWDARWQLADRLGGVAGRRVEADRLLVAFLEDPEEYVRRRALMALGALGSAHVEAASEAAWATGEEYPRIGALHALHRAGSARLSEYVHRAYEDGRGSVVANARKVEG